MSQQILVQANLVEIDNITENTDTVFIFPYSHELAAAS